MLIENLTNYCDMNYRQKCLNENCGYQNTGFGTHIPVDILSITFKTSINVMVSNIQVKIY